MDQRTTDPEQNLERTGDELEERLDKLDDKIDESRKEASARSEQNEDPFENVAGDWEDTDDDAGGEDAEGFDDPESVDDDDDDY
jgi:sugar-specific transcriptional regulator TrmB